MEYESFIICKINTAECQTTSTCVPFLAHKMSKLPGFDQHLPAKYSVFSLFFFDAEYYQSIEITLANRLSYAFIFRQQF
jgi:hypothetical protein